MTARDVRHAGFALYDGQRATSERARLDQERRRFLRGWHDRATKGQLCRGWATWRAVWRDHTAKRALGRRLAARLVRGGGIGRAGREACQRCARFPCGRGVLLL